MIKYNFVHHLYLSDGSPIFKSRQKNISNFFIHVLFCFQPFVLNRKPIFSINMVLHSLEFQIQWKILPFLESPPLTFPIVSSKESQEYFIIFLQDPLSSWIEPLMEWQMPVRIYLFEVKNCFFFIIDFFMIINTFKQRCSSHCLL